MGEDKKKPEDLAQLIDDWDSLPLDPNADDWDDEPIGFFNELDQLSAEQGANRSKIVGKNEITAGFDEIVTCEQKTFGLSSTADPTADVAHGYEPDELEEWGELGRQKDFLAELMENEGPLDKNYTEAHQNKNFFEDYRRQTGSKNSEPDGDAPEQPDISIADSLMGQEHFKKVEINIKDLAFDEPAAQEDGENSPTGAARKLAKTKTVILTLAILLAAGGLGLEIYKKFLRADLPSAQKNIPDLLVEASPKLAQAGKIELAPFYINIPGQPQDIIVEMQVTLKYEHQKNKTAIENQITAVRDLIYRLAQNKGQQLAADNILMQQFSQELMEQSNQLLGDGHISYVQINQFKVLP